MRIAVSGSRGITTQALWDTAIAESGFDVHNIISGMCKNSPDMLAVAWAQERGIPVYPFAANWKLGRGAGLARNTDMSKVAEGLVALWDGESRGTLDMIKKCVARGLPVYVVIVKNGKIVKRVKRNFEGRE